MFNININHNKVVFLFICLLFFESRQIKAQSVAICLGDSVVLRMNCTYSGSLQWQHSADAITWLNISGAVLDTLKAIPTSTTYYRSAIANEACKLVYSDTAIITVNPIPPSPSLSVVDSCGSSKLIAGNYSGTLSWSTGQTINPITVNIAGNYTVTQTINGCESPSAGISASPLMVPVAPVAGTSSPTTTQITWNWSTVANATGYKYNTVNNYSTATDNAGNLSYTQTGLTCNTAYTLYVWAYDGCGNSPVIMLTQTTSACCTTPPAPTVYKCGNILTASGYTGTLLWSTGQTTNPITVSGSGTYTVTQTIDGCTSPSSNTISITGSPPTSQFASSLISFSTQWPPPGWQATETLGSPNTCDCGDIQTAWASATTDAQREFLVLGFTTPQTVSKVVIYETYNPGAVDTVYLRNSITQVWNTVWSGVAAPALPCPRAFEISISPTSYTVDAIRIAINSPAVSSWNEIDAVEIQ